MTRQDIPLIAFDDHNVVLIVTKQAFDKSMLRRIHPKRAGLDSEQWDRVRADIDNRLDHALQEIWSDILTAIDKEIYF